MGMIYTLVLSLVIVIIFMSLFWFVSQRINKLAIVDIAWGLGFALIAISTLLFNQDFSLRKIIASIFVILWGIRLATYIGIRNRGKGEDFRYQKMKERWGSKAPLKSFINVFMLQGVFMIIVTFGIQFINTYGSNPIDLTLFDLLGIVIWIVGFIFETLADLQMYRFKSNPENKGKIMKYGLWKYSRHPNYFGESVQWFGIFFLALSIPNGLITVLSPLVITFMLLRVSGVPMLEAKYKGNIEYEEYIRKTSSFIPLPN